MKNVFQAGDDVYHPSAGKGKVTGTDGRLVYIITESGEGFCATGNLCSFSPWPEPNHIRPEPPVKEGWWLMRVKGSESDEGFLRYVTRHKAFISKKDAVVFYRLEDYVFIRYLGEDWTKETL